MLSVDSYRHFFRKMEHTINFLNELNSGGMYKVFDFKLHNVIGTDTAENMSRVFGAGYHGFKKKRKTAKALPKDLFGEEAIWHLLKEQGFMTMIGFDA
jgi:hypothetical protein